MRFGIYSELFEMLSIIVKSFLFFGQKNAFQTLFIYEYCMISNFRDKNQRLQESFETDHG